MHHSLTKHWLCSCSVPGAGCGNPRMTRAQPLPSRSSESPELCPNTATPLHPARPGQLPQKLSPALCSAPQQHVHIIYSPVISCLQHARLCGPSYCPIVIGCVYTCPYTLFDDGTMLVTPQCLMPATCSCLLNE